MRKSPRWAMDLAGGAMGQISDLTMFDEFSVRGRFWLPAQEAEAIAGQLTFSAGGIRLTLDGKFDVKELQDAGAIFGSKFRASVILGETIEGESCMLLRTVVLNVDWNKSEFAANQLLIGEGSFGEVEPQVAEVLVDFTHLEDWGFTPLIRTGPGSPGAFNIVVPTDKVELLRLEGGHTYKILTLSAAVATQLRPGEAHCAVHCHFGASFTT